MANIDNSCAGLPIEDLYASSNDTLGDILNLQAETQKNMTLREVMEFWHMNNHAMIDEI